MPRLMPSGLGKNYRQKRNGSMRLEEEFQRKGLSYEVLVELDSMDMVKRYVAMGMGVATHETYGRRLAMALADETSGLVAYENLASAGAEYCTVLRQIDKGPRRRSARF